MRFGTRAFVTQTVRAEQMEFWRIPAKKTSSESAPGRPRSAQIEFDVEWSYEHDDEAQRQEDTHPQKAVKDYFEHHCFPVKPMPACACTTLNVLDGEVIYPLATPFTRQMLRCFFAGR